MSGAQTSGFPNVLFNAPAAYNAAQTYQDNQLLMQQHQQAVTDHDIAAVGQAAAPLLNLSEDDAAREYPGWLQDMQSRGLAKYAPATYPGHTTTAALVQRAMPLIDQYKMGLMTSPGTQAILDRVFGTGGGSTGTGTGGGGGTTTIGGADAAPINAAGDSATRKAGEGGPPAAGTPGAQVAQQVHDFWIGKGYSEEQVAGIMAGGPGSESDFTPTVFGDKGTSYGLYQHHGPRLAAMQQFFGLSGSQMPSADQQNQYAAWEISPQGPLANVGAQLKQAKTPAEAAAIWTAGFGVPADKTEIGRRARGADRYLGRYASQPQQGGPGGATAPGVVTGDAGRPDLAPPPPGGALGAYPAMGAGVGAVVGQGVRPNIGGPQLSVAPPPIIRAQPIPAGRTAATDAIQAGIQQAQATPLPGTQVAGPPMVASTNPTASVAAPSVETSPQPGWGSTVGSYGPQNTFAPPPSPAQPVAAAPAPQQPPAAQPTVPTGVNSPQFQLAQQKLRQAAAIAAMPGYQYNPQLQAAAAYLKEQAAAYAQADSVVQGPGGVQIHTLTGKQDDPAKPLADYHETSPGSGIWVGGPGTEPRFQPPGRLVVTPGGDVYQTTSGGPRLLKSTDPAAVAALAEAKAAGAATGTAVAKQLPDLMLQARNAAAQEGQIDYATNQLREAAKAGVPSGYFSPALATAAAAAKSLGLDGPLRAVGINPEAVGNVQTAQKTLSVIGGAILRQALGPGSAITDGKIEAFIHTQPGIETDPQALQRIMAWARSQYTYERELGHAAVSEAAKPENAGRLPPHWLPAYYRDHGFAPIYDPGTQEMRQPDGSQSPRETPPAQGAHPRVDSDAAYNALPSGAIFVDPNGKMRKKP